MTARPEFDLTRGHRLYIEMLRATTSPRSDAAAVQHWRAEAEQLEPDDTSYYAMMARGVSMTHRDFLIGNDTRHRMRRAWAAFFQDYDVFLCPVGASPAQPHDHAGERWERSITVNGHRVPATDQMFWAGISGFFQLPATVAPLGFSPAGLPFGILSAVAGDADKVAAAVRFWAKAGADKVVLYPDAADPDPVAFIRFAAEQVQPLLR